MKQTTHELARQLLELPDAPIGIEGWYGGGGPILIKPLEYDEDIRFILVDGYFRTPEMVEAREANMKESTLVWMNIGGNSVSAHMEL